MNLTKLLLVLTLAVFARQGLNAQAGIDCIGGVSIIAPGNVSSLTLCQGDGQPGLCLFIHWSVDQSGGAAAEYGTTRYRMF